MKYSYSWNYSSSRALLYMFAHFINTLKILYEKIKYGKCIPTVNSLQMWIKKIDHRQKIYKGGRKDSRKNKEMERITQVRNKGHKKGRDDKGKKQKERIKGWNEPIRTKGENKKGRMLQKEKKETWDVSKRES